MMILGRESYENRLEIICSSSSADCMVSNIRASFISSVKIDSGVKYDAFRRSLRFFFI